MQMKKRGPSAIIHRNHLAMACAALPFFFSLPAEFGVWGAALLVTRGSAAFCHPVPRHVTWQGT